MFNDQAALASTGGRVRYVGDAVAAVAARTPQAARAALTLIQVDYELLPAITDAELALAALPKADSRDRAFYEGKVASARFFARHALPKTKARREAAEREDGALMELADEAF